MDPSFMLVLLRSFMKKCPQCGKGKIFSSYLKLYKNCSICEEEFSGFRTDDFGPWLTIILSGHIIVPIVLFVEQNYAPALWLQALVWIPLTIFVALLILPISKSICLVILWKQRDK
jgi:uncharacterized protein (DUF983 family)